MSENSPKIKIAFIGSRGIPSKYGGFETFVSEISDILADNGIRVLIQCEKTDNTGYQGSRHQLFYSSIRKSGNQLKYYYEGICWALKSSDIIYVTGTGGSMFYLLNLFRKKIIITNTDGLEHKRKKWSFIGRSYLKFSEFLAVHLSDYIVADSYSIKNYLTKGYRIAKSSKIKVIEYGAHLNNLINEGILKKYSLKHKGYYLIVARIEPENNIHLILEAFRKSATINQIVVIGNIINNKYVTGLVREYRSSSIRFLGGIYDKSELNAIRYSCRAYFHGHSVGGTNPSLLEALANGNLSVCHDNPFNRETTGSNQLYFSTAGECLQRIKEVDEMSEEQLSVYSKISYDRIKDYYNWANIGRKYLVLINEIIKNRRKV